MAYRELFEKMLNEKPSTAKKQVAVYLRQNQIEELNSLITVMNDITGGKVSRNNLIEDAIDDFITECEKYLEVEHGMKVTNADEAENQISGQSDKKYAIAVIGCEDGPLKGLSGLLSRNGEPLEFETRNHTETAINDIRSLCLGKTSVAEFECILLAFEKSPESRMEIEMIKEFNMIPEFDPQNYWVTDCVYGNAGGAHMVSTLKFYLPELNKAIWVNCDTDNVSICSMDYHWNDDESESYERYEDVMIYEAVFENELPNDVMPWLPMIKRTLEYAIENETANDFYCSDVSFHLHVPWLPESIRQKVDPEYLNWLQENGIKAVIAKDNQIIIDQEYLLIGMYVDRELIIEDNHINAYVAVWFDVDERLGLNTDGTDEFVNIYADYYPDEKKLDVFYVHHGPDGETINECPIPDLTTGEREHIIYLMKNEGMDKLIAEMDEATTSGINMQS